MIFVTLRLELFKSVTPKDKTITIYMELASKYDPREVESKWANQERLIELANTIITKLAAIK